MDEELNCYYYPYCKHFDTCANYSEASRILMCPEDGDKNPYECPIYIRVMKYRKCDEMFNSLKKIK